MVGILALAGCILTPLLIMMLGHPAGTSAAIRPVGTFPMHAGGATVVEIKPNAALNAALLTAAAKGQSVNVQDLLNRGADPNAADEEGQTALMKAAAAGHTLVVNALDWRGIKVNAKDGKGETALMKAAENGHAEGVSELLRLRTGLGGGPLVEVNDEDNQGQTALAKAKAKGHKEIVDMLKNAGAHE